MIGRDLARAVQRLADQNTDQLRDLPAGRIGPVTVTAVNSGAASDGRDLIAVTWRGHEVTCAGYDRTKTFAVGDRVMCDLTPGGLLFVDYAIGGTP